MKKGFAVTIIAMLLVMCVAFGVLYVTSDQQKSRRIVSLSNEANDLSLRVSVLEKEINDKDDEINTLNEHINEYNETINGLNADT